MLEFILAFLIGTASVNHNGTIIVEDSRPDDGSIVIKNGPRMKTNPTWICPDGTSNPPNLC